MRRALFILAAWLAALAVWALDVPPFTGLVVDKAGLLSSADQARLTGRLEAFQAAVTGQMAVLIVPSLKGDSIEDFGIRVADAWKAGRKGIDTGLILIVARDDRAMRIEVGYGFEGVINDARAGDVIRAMGPAFREGRYAQGLLGAVDQLEGYIRSGAAASGDGSTPLSRFSEKHLGQIFMGIFVAIFLWNIFFNRGKPSSGGRSGWGFGGGFGGGGFGGGGGFSGGGGGRFGGGGASGKW